MKIKFNIQKFGGRGASSNIKGVAIKSLLRKYGVSQDELYSKTGFHFEDLKSKNNFNEAERLFKGITEGKSTTEQKSTYNAKAYVPTFKGNKGYEKAISNGYINYRGNDLNTGGWNYTEIANKLKAEGYKVRVFEDTTRVRGIHNYYVLYKRKN